MPAPFFLAAVYKQLGIAIVAGYVLARWQSSLPENAASTSL